MMQFTPILDEFRQIFPYVFAGDLVRYLIGAGSVFLVVWVIFRSRLGYRKIRTSVPPVGQIWREIGHSLVTVCIFASVGTAIGVGATHGLFSIYADVSLHGWFYLIGSVVAMIIAQDTYFYWVHRLMHRVPLLWKLHAAHHRSHNPTPWTAYAFDPGEALIHALFMPMFVAIVPMHVGGLFAFTAHMMLRNAIGHCGYELFPKGWADRPIMGLVTMVTHHDIHHEHAPRNFGLYFTWWDRLMGTEHLDYRMRTKLVTSDNEIRGNLEGTSGRAKRINNEFL